MLFKQRNSKDKKKQHSKMKKKGQRKAPSTKLTDSMETEK